jgi:hypothetical protein
VPRPPAAYRENGTPLTPKRLLACFALELMSFSILRHFMLAKDHAAPEGISERYAPFYDDEMTHFITSEQRLNR